MRIFKEGETGFALASGRGRVRIAYRYRDYRLDSGIVVKDVLVGVDQETGEILVIPPQSTPKIKLAREKKKDKVLSIRISCEMDDVLWVVSDHLNTTPATFASPLIRYYLNEASDNDGLARRLSRLCKSELAQSPYPATLKVRSETDFLDAVKELARRQRITTTDAVRGALLAAFEDVVENKAPRRAKELKSIAAAV